MAGFEKFTNFIKEKVAAKKKREKREKDPTSEWTGASDSQKKRYKIIEEALRKKKEAKEKEKQFYKDHNERVRNKK